jgi:hypothetical protein
MFPPKYMHHRRQKLALVDEKSHLLEMPVILRGGLLLVNPKPGEKTSQKGDILQ